MKTLSLVLFSFLCFISYDLSAQTPRQIEDDLLKSFKKIDYWDQQRSKDTSMAWSDSLEKANDVFWKEIKRVCSKVSCYYNLSFQFTCKRTFEYFQFSRWFIPDIFMG